MNDDRKETAIFWLSPEKAIERQITYRQVSVRARVWTLKYPEGKTGCVWPEITDGEWLELIVEAKKDVPD